jgi:hypothetical protein
VSGPLECRAASRPGVLTFTSYTAKLKVELKGKLHFTRIPGLLHLAKRGVAEVSVRINELRLVEEIENVCAELEISRF